MEMMFWLVSIELRSYKVSALFEAGHNDIPQYRRQLNALLCINNQFSGIISGRKSRENSR